MKKTLLILWATCLFVGNLAVAAQAEDVLAATVARIRDDLAYLAADEQEGRNVGSEGIARAGEFIAQRFQELGLRTDSFEGTPYQDFSIPGPSQIGPTDRNVLAFSGVEAKLEPVLGQSYNPLSLGSNGTFDGTVAFVGYGITATEWGYDDYAGIDVDGKVVIVLRKEPQQQLEDSVFDGLRSSQYAYFSSKELNASLHKAAALILVNDRVTVGGGSDQLMEVTAAGGAVSESQVPTFYCSRDLIDPIVRQGTGKSLAELEEAIDVDLKPQSQILDGITARGETLIEQSRIPVRNVIGLLPGAGTLAEEYVVVGAHYDHVGMGGQGSLAPGTIAVHNGADDNASGTTALLEVARRLAANPSENRRSLIFMAFTGEEKGLLGSKHYVRNPRWPLENTVAMVNMDMVGRLNENTLTVFGTGTATTFDDLVDRLNETSQFNLDKRVAGFGPSDHSSFYEAEIPVFHIFTGLHNDYHRPSDDVDKVNYEGMARIVGMVTEMVTELSTVEERPEYVKTSAVARVGRGPGRSRGRRAVLGIQLELNREADGAPIAAVPGGSPAAEAGLQAGDVIVKIDNNEIGAIRDLRSAMSGKKPGDEVTIVVRRGEEQVEVQVVLGEG